VIRDNLEYTLPGMCPAWLQQLQRNYSFTFNQLIYAITDVKKDIARLKEDQL